jgi:hypothetical protein
VNVAKNVQSCHSRDESLFERSLFSISDATGA